MGVFNCKLHVNFYLLIILIIMNSCTSEIVSDIDFQALEIERTYIEYDSSGLLVAQVEFVQGSPIDELLSVQVEFQIPGQEIFKDRSWGNQ